MLWLPFCSTLFHFLLNNELAITPERQNFNIFTNLHGRYTSQYNQQAVGRLLIKCFCCFPLQLISSVWSPQSIEFSLQQFCLPFLRLSCLLQHHLYGDNLTGCQVCFITSVILPAETTLPPRCKLAQYFCSSFVHYCYISSQWHLSSC